MKSFSNVAPPTTKNKPPPQHRRETHRSPIPPPAVYVLLALFVVGLCVSTFFLIVVHNALFFLLLLCISTLVAAFLLWNSRNAAVSSFLHSFPDSDINLATHGQLVKITGVVSCGNVSLESSYEKVSPCVYTSTMLYEYKHTCLKALNVLDLCLSCTLAYSERHSTDFYITDMKSGIRALVKAGPDSKVIPLIIESRLIKTSKRCRVLSSDFRKWLMERKVSDEARSLCLQEGYVKEGSFVSVLGILLKSDDVVMIVEPHEIVSTGCQWRKLLLPIDVEGLVIGSLESTIPTTHTTAMHCP